MTNSAYFPKDILLHHSDGNLANGREEDALQQSILQRDISRGENRNVTNSVTQMLAMIPERCELSIRSWNDGVHRQYACTLTDVFNRKNRWTSSPSTDLHVALSAATMAPNVLPVNYSFWKGAKSAAPINVLLWAFLLLIFVYVMGF